MGVLASTNPRARVGTPFILGPAVNTETLSGNKTMARSDSPVQFLDPGGANRNVDLPAEEEGLVYIISNEADMGSEDLTVREDTGMTTVVTVSQNEVAIVVSDGTGWAAMVAATT